MTDLILLCIGLAAGGAAGYLWARHLMAREDATNLDELKHAGEANAALRAGVQLHAKNEQDLKAQLQRVQAEHLELTASLRVSENQYENMAARVRENKQELEALHTTMLEQFTLISGRVLKENSQEFSLRSTEKLALVLDPLKEKIQKFEQKVQDTYEKNLKDHTSLKSLIENLRDLNYQIGADAKNLTLALKGEKKTQGNWGENILEKLLERSGLEKEVHYRREVSLNDENGKLNRPDVIIDLPEGKHIIIDSKVSLNAYEACYNSEEDEMMEIKLKEHLRCLKSHIQLLSNKKYEQLPGLNTPDFVLMFIPIEPAFNLAMQHDNTLFHFALDRNIVLVTNSTLLATLKTIASLWKQESQKKHVLEIAEESGRLYDKFVGFVADMESIGAHIDATRKSYDGAFNKLRQGKGNLISRADKIKKLGAKAGKSLEENLVQKALENEPSPDL